MLHTYGKAETGEFLVLNGQTSLAKTASSGAMLSGDIRWTAPEEHNPRLTSDLHGSIHACRDTCAGERKQGKGEELKFSCSISFQSEPPNKGAAGSALTNPNTSEQVYRKAFF